MATDKKPLTKAQRRRQREQRRIPLRQAPKLAAIQPDLTGQETQAGTFRTLRNTALWHLLRTTGMRIGEAVAARLPDLMNLDQPGEEYLEITDSKNGSSREVDLNGSADLMRRYLEARGQYARTAGTDAIFVSQEGRPLSRRQAIDIVNGLLEQILGSRKPRQSTHQFRHLKASQWAEENVPPADAATYLGHTVETYYRAYVRVSPTAARQRIRRHEAGKVGAATEA